MGTDDLHKERRKKRNTQKTRIEQKAVLIALEDTKSSKFYFEELLKNKKLVGQVIFAKHIGTDPENVVNAVVEHLKKYPNEKYEKKWAVIDKDDWSKQQINEAINKAKKLDICIAISNEAYELWILLHFQPLTRYTHRSDLNSILKKIFKEKFGIEYSKSSRDIYAFIIGFQQQAISNAKHLVQMQIENHGKFDPCEQNPVTTIFELVEYLNSLYSKEKKEFICFPH